MTPVEENVAFYYELGLAITQWSHIENDLCNLALSFLRAEDRNAMALGFFSIENFRSKLKYTDSIVNRKLSDGGLLRDWKRLHDRISAASVRRNALAHWPMRIYTQDRPGSRYVLVPWIGKKPKSDKERSLAPAEAIAVQDINKCRLEFAALALSVTNFTARAHGHAQPIPDEMVRAMTPSNLQQLASQLRKALGPGKLSTKEKRRLEDEKNAAASLKDA
jgi:hypothetical protein